MTKNKKSLFSYFKFFIRSFIVFWGIGSLFYFLEIMNIIDFGSVVGFSISMSLFSLYYLYLFNNDLY